MVSHRNILLLIMPILPISIRIICSKQIFIAEMISDFKKNSIIKRILGNSQNDQKAIEQPCPIEFSAMMEHVLYLLCPIHM